MISGMRFSRLRITPGITKGSKAANAPVNEAAIAKHANVITIMARINIFFSPPFVCIIIFFLHYFAKNHLEDQITIHIIAPHYKLQQQSNKKILILYLLKSPNELMLRRNRYNHNTVTYRCSPSLDYQKRKGCLLRIGETLLRFPRLTAPYHSCDRS